MPKGTQNSKVWSVHNRVNPISLDTNKHALQDGGQRRNIYVKVFFTTKMGIGQSKNLHAISEFDKVIFSYDYQSGFEK